MMARPEYNNLFLKLLLCLTLVVSFIPASSQAALQMRLTLDNTLSDSSGNSNNGSFPGGSANPNYATGVLNQGLNFDGSNDFIRATNFDPGSTFSVTLWMRADTLNSIDTYIEHARTNRRNDFFVGYDGSLNQLFVQLEASSTDGEDAACGDPKFCTGVRLYPNRWYHLAVIVTPTTLTVYVDGEQAYTTTHTTTVDFNPGDWLIGGDTDSNPADTPDSDFFDGRLDDIRVYNHALSQAEVSDTMNLLAFWKFDECSWSMAGDVADASGHAYNGTATNGADTEAGKLCQAGSFDGSNDYIALNSLPNLTGSFTIAAWINPNAIDSDQRIFADDEGNSGGFAFSLGDAADGRLRFFSRNVNPVSLDTPTLISTGSWYYVVAVHNASAKTMQIFVNGALAASQTYTGSWGSDSGTASIGGETDGAGAEAVPNWRFNGLIDEMRISQRALTSEEISDYFTRSDPLSRTCPTCIPSPSETLYLSTADGETLGGLTFTDGSVVAYDSLTDTAVLFFDENNFSGNEDIDALHVLSNGLIVLSVSGNASLGGLSFSDGDIVSYDPNTNTATLLFDENNFSNNEDVDAVYVRENGNILLSTDGSATLGGLSFNADDVVEYNPNTNTATLFFNGNNFSGNENIDAIHLLDNGHLLLSTDSNATLGGLSFGAGDVVEYNIGSNTASLYFAESNFSNSADVNALSLLTAATGLHHIQLEHDGNGLTCEPETITVRTCANADCSSIYTGNVNISFAPTGWSGGDTQTISGGTGSLQLPHTTPGVISLGVSSSSPSASNAYVCLNTVTTASSCSLTYYDTGFIYSIPTQTSCTTSNAITISAVRKDDITQACLPTFVSQARTLHFSLSYSNPATGTTNLNLNYNSSNYAITPAGSDVAISFDSNGQASFTTSYSDAGQITLNSSYTGSAGTNDASLSMLGNASYVTKPAKLYVYSPDANSDCASATVACSTFVHAGDNFNLAIRGACDDASNTVTPNFQLAGLTLSHLNVAPAIAQGNLAVSSFDIGAADNGEHIISTQNVNEVGAFSFTAALPGGGYFGESIGDTSLNTSAVIGRFTPDHFCLTSNSLLNRTDSHSATGCSDVSSYLDEQFQVSFSLRAQASTSVCSSTDVTQNYSGTWSRFSSPFVDDTTNANEVGKWNLGAVQDPAGAATDLRARITIDTGASSPSAGSFTNGEINVTTVLDINRQGSAPGYSAEAELNDVHLTIKPLDLDSVALDTTSLTIGADTYRDVGNTTLYFGRLFAENAFGTNASDIGLDMYARTEYCHASASGVCTDWQSNVSDSCSLYNITPPAGTALGLLAANDGQGYYERASAATTSSVFNFDDPGSAPSYARVHVPDTNQHSAGWRLFCDGCGDGGSYTIPFSFPFNSPSTVHPYLLHVDGVATFGQFRGDDRIIYWREILK